MTFTFRCRKDDELWQLGIMLPELPLLYSAAFFHAHARAACEVCGEMSVDAMIAIYAIIEEVRRELESKREQQLVLCKATQPCTCTLPDGFPKWQIGR